MNTEIETLYHDGIRESYTRIRHKSGMTVCVMPKETAVTYASLGVLCGAVDNCFTVNGERMTVPDGTAHFLEHKLFAAGEDEADAIARFAELGANADAYTTPDMTAYLFSAAENERAALEILLDFVFRPYFTEENVERERAIIAQEIRMYDDAPSQRGYYNAVESLYHTHPIRVNVGGTEESIRDITPDVLYTFYRAFYHPVNMVLTVAGNLSPDDVLAVCDACIPHDLPPFVTERMFEKEPDTVFRREYSDTAQMSSPVLYFGVKDTELSSDWTARETHAAAVDILNDILFCKSSPLYTDLYDRGLINGKFGFEYELAATYAYVLITAETDEPETVAKEIRQHLSERVRLHDITDEQFERCRRVMYASAVTAFESAEDMMSECLDAAIDGGEMFSALDIMMAVTKDDLFRVLDRLYTPERYAVSILYPERI
ncbi:MAG: insulinase family protein [Clostridia bacterium]|nr:insulinase family protein [Clostridia bacterium]